MAWKNLLKHLYLGVQFYQTHTSGLRLSLVSVWLLVCNLTNYVNICINILLYNNSIKLKLLNNYYCFGEVFRVLSLGHC